MKASETSGQRLNGYLLDMLAGTERGLPCPDGQGGKVKSKRVPVMIDAELYQRLQTYSAKVQGLWEPHPVLALSLSKSCHTAGCWRGTLSASTRILNRTTAHSHRCAFVIRRWRSSTRSS